MKNNQKRWMLTAIWVLGLFYFFTAVSFAAKPIDLAHKHGAVLQTFETGKFTIKEISRLTDSYHTVHVRIQEMYSGYPVWGADGVKHIPHGDVTRQSFNGIFYQDLGADLADTPAYVFNSNQAEKAIQAAVTKYQDKFGKNLDISAKKSSLIIFVDKNTKAHFAFKISFNVAPVTPEAMPAKPVFIMDAASLFVYKYWNNIHTIESDESDLDVTNQESFGGGIGSNKGLGKVYYDGRSIPFHLNKLTIIRKAESRLCQLKNSHVIIRNFKTGSIMGFRCLKLDHQHNDVYWNNTPDAANGGYSPSNDALYGGEVISSLYKAWYGMLVLTNDNGSPMMLSMIVHKPMANAYWDGEEMTFGDGDNTFFPFTTLDIAAHEVSHGFTEEHSDLVYEGQSGGINESFSDMAGQAALFYATKTNNWQIGAGISKRDKKPLRYMDEPTKDGYSIDNASNYKDSLNVHYTSGVFNKAFYLLATTPNWDTRKAFDTMVRANVYYWTSTTDFQHAACGVMSAAKDLNYETADVAAAFTKVGIDSAAC